AAGRARGAHRPDGTGRRGACRAGAAQTAGGPALAARNAGGADRSGEGANGGPAHLKSLLHRAHRPREGAARAQHSATAEPSRRRAPRPRCADPPVRDAHSPREVRMSDELEQLKALRDSLRTRVEAEREALLATWAQLKSKAVASLLMELEQETRRLD